MNDTTAQTLARNIRRRRTELGYSQRRLAAEMVAAGCADWVGSTVANAERLDKPRVLTVEELGALCVALRCSLEELVPNELTDRLHGRSPEAETTAWSARVAVARREEIFTELRHRLAMSLGVIDDDVDRIADDLFGRDVLDERDARLHGDPPDDPRDRAKRLGHVTRAIRDELAEYLDQQRLPGTDHSAGF